MQLLWGSCFCGTVKYADCVSSERQDPHLPKKCPGYDNKLSDDETPGLGLWVTLTTPLFPLLPGPLWIGVELTFCIPFMDHIELFNHLTKQTNKWCWIEFFVYHSNTWK